MKETYSLNIKITPCSFYCSVYTCWPISTISDTEYSEKICNTKVIDLPTSPTRWCCTTLGNISSIQLIARWFFFSSRPMWVALKTAVFFGAEMRMQTWRWTELLQMLEVTTTQAVKRSHTTSPLSSCLLLKSFLIWVQFQIREQCSRKIYCLFGLRD